VQPPSVATRVDTPVASAKVAAKPSSKPTATKPQQAPAEKPASETAAGPVVTTPMRDSTAPPAKPVEVPAPVKPVAAAPQQADTAQSDKATIRKDGTYTGWGTSRHGDIQATVQIKDGKIIFAAITECLTRYSCSWIAALPPQVLTRQSPEVDFVSGATESTNAFYYAVVEALNKAK
jgi:uncharacterized protein with FMN-binding domain